MSEHAQDPAKESLDGGGKTPTPPPSEISQEGQNIVSDEVAILERVTARIAQDAQQNAQTFESLDGTLIELRDLIAEAKEEDVSSLIDQMHQVAALNAKQGQGRSLPVDISNPYFGHLRLQAAGSNKPREVLIGKRTMLDNGDGLSIVDWRNAPVSRLYYRYDEGDDYEEEFDERMLEGCVLVRRSLTIGNGQLRRIDSPQGTFVSDRNGQWRLSDRLGRAILEGGVGKATRVSRGQLGIYGEGDSGRTDKHLQEITALIDREQFALITQPDSGVVLIQGGAGSGKTTVALHRVAYLAFQDRRRFAPSRMLIVVFNEALVEYIKHVLPALNVEGVNVTTYRRWTLSLIRRLNLKIPLKRSTSTPDPVSRFKKHPVVIRMIEELLEEQLENAKQTIAERLKDRAKRQEVEQMWTKHSNLPAALRVDRALDWLSKGPGNKLPAKTRTASETAFRLIREEIADIVQDWLELFGDSSRIRKAIGEYAKEEFSESDISSITKWCTQLASKLSDEIAIAEEEEEENQDQESGKKRKRNQAKDRDDDDYESDLRQRELLELDGEDDAIFLRLLQVKYGGIIASGKRINYEHIVIDEAQDLCPLEIRVLLDCATQGKSVTIAGDRAQKMIFDNGFQDWPQLLSDAGLPHIAVQPLKITYRSTRQVMELARHVLGPLHDPSDELIARDGAHVSYYGFGDIGESVAFLADALRGLMAREPSASVALITRFPQQAQMYYEGLHIAEVPRLRLVSRQDFSFQPGVDVTDVRHVKGLEFDYVVVLDPTAQNYPDRTESRHLLHIACTRTAFQLWLVCSGKPSVLIPSDLVEAGEWADD